LKAPGCYGQHVLEVRPAAPADAPLLGRYRYQGQQPDSAAALLEGRRLLQALQADGYLLAGLLRQEQRGDTTRLTVAAGELFAWLQLRPGNLDERQLLQAGYRERFYSQKPFSYQQVARLMRRIIEEAENRGYPFAQVRLDSLEIGNNQIGAALFFDPGPYITFDSLQLSGDARIGQRFLAAHLGIQPGEPFSQQRIAEAVQRLEMLPYLRLAEPPRLSFQNREARLWLTLRPRPANRFDGIVALQSRPTGGVLLTGQVDLLLQNPFGGGKLLAFNWQRLNEESQQLELGYQHPYILGSPLSLLLDGGLLKDQQQFLTRRATIALQSRQGRGLLLALAYEFKDARLLDEARGPNLASFRLHKWGVRGEYSRLDSRLNPRQGWLLEGGIMAGPKEITAVPDGSSFTTGKSLQLSGQGAAARYWMLSTRSTLVLQGQGAYLHDERLFLPDLYRLGGLRSLRGFREQSLFAARYGLLQAELRQQLGNSSYLFLFYDQGWLYYRLPATRYQDWPSGLGSGLSLQTTAGQFSLVYALGRQQHQPFSIRNSQVHFGYTSRF
jgi:outer membrane protein assembly factor BamA